jgi:hypothetical protein
VARTHTATAAYVLLLVAFACEGSSGPSPTPTLDLPQLFRLTGHASGTSSGGLNIDCYVDLGIELTEELRRDAELVEYAGRLGGEAGRSVLAWDGSGLGFFADLAGQAVARRFAPDSFELELPRSRESESRFWRGIGFFAGTLAPRAPWAGLWQCAPFDITEGGYVDTSGIAVGTWRIEPHPSPQSVRLSASKAASENRRWE